MKGDVVKSLSVTQMVDRSARNMAFRLIETAVGFKYICQTMVARDVLIGGEESGGLAVRGHILNATVSSWGSCCAK